jgi:tetratricopeptide (TPR) repeat protein
MPGNSTQNSRTLLIGVVSLLVVVVALGAVIVVLQLRPSQAPQTDAERELRTWQEAADENPEAGWAHTGLGTALLRTGDVDQAFESFEKAVTLDPDQWLSWMQLGRISAEEDPETAILYLTESTRRARGTDKALPFLALGDLLDEQGDLSGAQEAFEESIAAAPFVFDGHFRLAEILEARGDVSGAIQQYRRAGEFDPNNKDVAEALERLGAGDDPQP